MILGHLYLNERVKLEDCIRKINEILKKEERRNAQHERQ